MLACCVRRAMMMMMMIDLDLDLIRLVATHRVHAHIHTYHTVQDRSLNQWMFAVPSLVYRPQYVLRRTIINSLLLLPPSELAIEPLSEQLAHMADDMMIAATERTPSSCYVLFLAEVAAANAWVAASADDVLKVYDNETGVLRATLSVRERSSYASQAIETSSQRERIAYGVGDRAIRRPSPTWYRESQGRLRSRRRRSMARCACGTFARTRSRTSHEVHAMMRGSHTHTRVLIASVCAQSKSEADVSCTRAASAARAV